MYLVIATILIRSGTDFCSVDFSLRGFPANYTRLHRRSKPLRTSIQGPVCGPRNPTWFEVKRKRDCSAKRVLRNDDAVIFPWKEDFTSNKNIRNTLILKELLEIKSRGRLRLSCPCHSAQRERSRCCRGCERRHGSGGSLKIDDLTGPIGLFFVAHGAPQVKHGGPVAGRAPLLQRSGL